MKSLKRIKLIKKFGNEEQLENSYRLLNLLVKNKSNPGVSNELSPRFGLCNNTKLSELPKKYLNTLFKNWEEFSGNLEYPVESPDSNKCSGEYYRYADSKYLGAYGEARIRLAEYLIKKMKKDLKNLNA